MAICFTTISESNVLTPWRFQFCSMLNMIVKLSRTYCIYEQTVPILETPATSPELPWTSSWKLPSCLRGQGVECCYSHEHLLKTEKPAPSPDNIAVAVAWVGLTCNIAYFGSFCLPHWNSLVSTGKGADGGLLSQSVALILLFAVAYTCHSRVQVLQDIKLRNPLRKPVRILKAVCYQLTFPVKANALLLPKVLVSSVHRFRWACAFHAIFAS